MPCLLTLNIHAIAQVELIMSRLKSNRKIAVATHNIVAYRQVIITDTYCVLLAVVSALKQSVIIYGYNACHCPDTILYNNEKHYECTSYYMSISALI